MIRFIADILVFVAVLILGAWIFGIDPTWQEIALILVATTAGEIAAEAVR